MRRIIYHRLAQKELFQIRDYYDNIIFGLGNSFLMEIGNSLERIIYKPHVYYNILRNIRKCKIKIFPYSIYYSFDEDVIKILAIAHHKRKPFYWKKRIIKN